MATSSSIQSLTDTEKINFLWYGDPGIGKTRLVGTIAKILSPGKKLLIIRPPVDHVDSITDDRSKIDQWVVTDWAAMDDVLLYCRTEAPEKYEWCVLDSVSLWFDQGLDDIWDITIAEKPHRARWGLDKPEYGINMDRTTRWVRAMVGAQGFHFGMTAHANTRESTEDPDNPERKLMPSVQGKNMPPKLCGYMNMVGYYHWAEVGRAGTKARVLDLNLTNTYYAKDQFDATDTGRIINPTMPKVVEGIVASRGIKKPRAPKRTKPAKGRVGKPSTTTKRPARRAARRTSK